MSYCRLSSDSFRCDIYCYEDVSNQYVIHVAANKPVLPDDVREPDLPAYPTTELTQAWFLAHNKFMAELSAAPRVPLTAPSAGMTFTYDDPAAALGKLIELRAEGLRFPDYVLEELGAEVRDAEREG